MRSAVIAGAILGVAELCKLTLLVFYPLLVVLWVLDRWKNQSPCSSSRLEESKQLIVLFLVSLFFVNCGYLFEGSFTPLKDFRFRSKVFTGCESLQDVPLDGANRFDGSRCLAETLLGHIPVPLPASMVRGIDRQRCDFEKGMPSYLRGEHAKQGWWYYYLYALVVKMPIGTWGLLGLALVCTLFLKGYGGSWRNEMIVILPGLTLFVFVSSQTGFSTHSRYILPALPFLFVWIGKVGMAFTREIRELNPHSTKCVRVLAVIFLTWTIASSLYVYPHSLSYFNELAAVLPTPYDDDYPTPVSSRDAEEKSIWKRVRYVLDAGPRNGPRHLLGSNIDWGQDLFYLEEWYESHAEARPIRAGYWGSYPLELSRIENAGRIPRDPQPGWYAVSVNHLYHRHQEYWNFLNFEPVAMVGYSICIYHITLDDANCVRRELGLPKLHEDLER